MFLKIHDRDGEVIVAVLDKELAGRVLRQPPLVLDLGKHAAFYGTKAASAEQVKAALLKATSANLVGRKALSAAIDAGLATPESGLRIGGVPHVQLYKV